MQNITATLTLIFMVLFNALSVTADDEMPGFATLEPSINHGVSWPYLQNNLQTYFRVESLREPDSNLVKLAEEKFSDAISRKDATFKRGGWVIGNQYWLKSIPNLVFLEASSLIADYPPNDIAYDKVTDSLYLLNYISIDQLKNIIPPSVFSLSIASQILDYCRLFTLLHNCARSVRFISSINELLLEAIYSEPISYDLDNVREFDKVIVDIPSIRGMKKSQYGGSSFRGKDTVEVSFYMAEDDEIVNVNMVLTKRDIISYDEKVVGKTLDWYGMPR